MAYQTVTPTKLGQAAITAAVTTLYTVPANTRTILKTIDICNTGTTSLTVTIYLVPSAGTAGTSNELVPGITIGGNSMFQWSGVQVLNVGDTIQMVASATGATIIASGGEAT